MNQVSKKHGLRAALVVLGLVLIAGSRPLPAQANTVMQLDGVSQTVAIASAPELMNPSLLTVECWARPWDANEGRLVPDAMTFGLIAMAPLAATPGNLIHWTYPFAGYPSSPFTVPAGSLPAGLSIEFLAVAVVGAELVPAPVTRIALN